ncbi:kinesin, putative [Bodo saltans]|uniref:Kinesin, putative n=1 Tax=Bodo saltans TaxID=75058 RepID=A0A0S4IZQ2_BODSA|nr:kinesin, putative [Bodo saltans]|eukprot:CUG35991.1 kinesin, putative [Bodo saltans]
MSKRNLHNNRRQVQHLDAAEDAANNVRVILRVRPLLPSEAERGETPNAKILPDGQSVLISAQMSQSRKVETQQHRLDCVFGPSINQRELFHQSGVEHYCESALEGMTSTVFCFGQTGSGKTYTMSGPLMDTEELDNHAGLQYRAAHFMANAAEEINRTYGSASFSPVVLRSSYIEIYNEAINDLLNETSGLKLRWSQSAQSFFIENLMMVKCDDVSDLLAVLTEGNNNRKRASHLLNVDSTRSHVIFTMYVERRDAPDAPAKLGKVVK